MHHTASSLLVLVAICASTSLACAQLTPATTDNAVQSNAASTPVAYVYVSNRYNIRGYYAASNGVLTPIPGTPYPSTTSALALNGKWLFGIDASDHIISYQMAANGSLKMVDTYVSVYSPDHEVDNLFLDHKGATLYDHVNAEGNYSYESLKINQSTGQLSFISSTLSDEGIASFIGNNTFAYSSGCVRFPAPDIYGYKRSSDGSLVNLFQDGQMPTSAAADLFYCPLGTAADPTNHIAVSMQQNNFDTGAVGPTQLATYTADASGNLTTTSTYQNMPMVKVVGTFEVRDLAMSTGGAYLAVTGDTGLQIFHFHGAKPITNFTGALLSGTEVDQAFWDKKDHLYAISRTANKLYVFNVSAAGATQAKGSPYTIPQPAGLSVLSK